MIKSSSILVIIVSFLALACSSTPNNVLPVNTMKVVMFDMLKADDWYARIIVGDTLMQRVKEDIPLYEQVFAVHKLTKKQFFESYHYYESHPVAYKELIDSLESYGNNQKLKMLKN